jgi:hypothetical protein
MLAEEPMYLFYLDESGEREYTSRGQYFVLCALGVKVQDWKSLNGDVLTLKKTYFNNPLVEIKSNWLRIPKERSERYLDLYHITPDELNEFVQKLYDALLSYDVTLMASVVDKHRMQTKYVNPQSPSSVAYRHLIERVELFLEGLDAPDQSQRPFYGLMVFDKITELQVQRQGYENLLSRQHLRYLEKGTDYIAVNHIVEGLLFIPSAENNLLQLADLCAYNIHRQFIDHGAEWETSRGFTNHYGYFTRIEPKLHRSASGSYRGYGIKMFP